MVAVEKTAPTIEVTTHSNYIPVGYTNELIASTRKSAEVFLLRAGRNAESVTKIEMTLARGIEDGMVDIKFKIIATPPGFNPFVTTGYIPYFGTDPAELGGYSCEVLVQRMLYEFRGGARARS